MENNKIYFCYDTFQRVSLELVNNLRNQHGLEALRYNKILQEGADVRAKELMDYGNLAVNGVPHVRINGDSFVTAFSYIDRNKYRVDNLGENLALIGNYLINAQVSKKETAEQLAVQIFHNLENSPGHYENMISLSYKDLAVGVEVNYNIEKRQLGYLRVNIIGVQSFAGIENIF